MNLSDAREKNQQQLKPRAHIRAQWHEGQRLGHELVFDESQWLPLYTVGQSHVHANAHAPHHHHTVFNVSATPTTDDMRNHVPAPCAWMLKKKTCGRWAHNFYSYTKPEPRERGIRILHFTCGGSSSDVCACYACHHVDRAYWGLNSLSALISPLSAKREPLLRFAVWSTGKKTLLLWTERKAFSKHLLNICTITSPKASAAFRHSCVPWRPSRPREQTNRISA